LNTSELRAINEDNYVIPIWVILAIRANYYLQKNILHDQNRSLINSEDWSKIEFH